MACTLIPKTWRLLDQVMPDVRWIMIMYKNKKSKKWGRFYFSDSMISQFTDQNMCLLKP